MISVVSDKGLSDVITMVVLPKLTHTLSLWGTPSGEGSERGRPGHWLVPWWPYLESYAKTSLIPGLSRKLGQMAEGWSAERSGNFHDVIEPCLSILGAKVRVSLLSRFASRLAAQLRTHVKVNPADQQLNVLEKILTCAKVFPSVHMAALLKGEFFPMWKQALYQWIRTSDSGANSDLVRWYEGWKKFLCSYLGSDDALILDEFSDALDLMHQGRSLPETDFHQTWEPVVMQASSYSAMLEMLKAHLPPTPEPIKTSSSNGTVNGSRADGGEPGGSSSYSASFSGSEHMMHSFKDVVDAFAQRNGEPFLLKHGRFLDGKQLYSFSGVTVYLDLDVVHHEVAKGDWRPVGLEDLLVWCRQARKSKKGTAGSGGK